MHIKVYCKPAISLFDVKFFRHLKFFYYILERSVLIFLELWTLHDLFPKCDNALQEAKQAVELIGKWEMIDVADALELLSPDFESDEVCCLPPLFVHVSGFLLFSLFFPLDYI